jgi:hypothetical protein
MWYLLLAITVTLVIEAIRQHRAYNRFLEEGKSAQQDPGQVAEKK